MELEDLIRVVFLTLFLGTPLASVYFCLRFFGSDSERLLATAFFVWLEWLIGFILVTFYIMVFIRFGSPDTVLLITFITGFTVFNPLLTTVILNLSERRDEQLNIFEERSETPAKKPSFIIQKAFLTNIAATLTILALFGCFFLIATTMEKYFPKKQEFTLYDS